jgi:hypothetical protein
MVAMESGDVRNFYMVSIAMPDQACAEVNRITGMDNAQVLAPVTDETLDHYEVRSNSAWIYLTTNRWTGEVGSSRLDGKAL